jgi:tartrate-resistant acid phosphatase type 5
MDVHPEHDCVAAVGCPSIGKRVSSPLSDSPHRAQPSDPLLALIQTPPIRLAVIGDYGVADERAQDVADLVTGWHPDFIITTGDNNYPAGEASTIDRHIGAYYHAFIAPYQGQYGPGSDINRFFPSLGNHDWLADAIPYLAYFTLPGNERYYDFVWGPLHLFALDSHPREPDGVTPISIQAAWLQQAVTASQACWQMVYMHHPPFSSGPHGSTPWMQWPYQTWGVDVVLAGHDHTYERLLKDELPYFVNGLGGNVPYPFQEPVDDSVVRYNSDVGAMLVEASTTDLRFWFINREGRVIDRYHLHKPCPAHSSIAL